MTNSAAYSPDSPHAPFADERDPHGHAELLSQIRALETSHASPVERVLELLNISCHSLGALAGAVTVSLGADDLDRVTEDGPLGVDAWHASLRHAALETRSLGHSIGQVFGEDRGRPEYVILAAPLDDASQEPFGGLAVLCPWQSREHAQALQMKLRVAMILAAPLLRPKVAPAATLHADDFARVIAKSGQYSSLHEFAYAVTNAVKQKFGAEAAALSIVERHKPKIVCISGLDHVKRRSPGVHHMEQAMGECLDAGTVVIEQDRDRWEGSGDSPAGLLHQRWRAAIGGGCILSMPLNAGDSTQAVLSLVRHESDPFKPEEVEALTKLVAPIAVTLPLVRRCTRSLPSHTLHSLTSGGRWIMRPKSRTRQIALVCLLALLAWFTFKPTMYRVTTNASVIAEREVVVASPRDAAIDAVLVRSGDRVVAGQPIVRLDTRDLRIRRADLQSEVERARLELKQAIAASDPAAAASARALRDVHAATLAHVEHQIKASTITAPADGIVLGVDLLNLTGRVLPAGEAMLSIADESSLMIELEIPERRVTDLSTGSRVRFASNARPEDAGMLTLEHVEPSASARGDRSVFIGYGGVPQDQPWLRPGMEGVAMIDAGRKPNWWLGARHLLDAAHLNFWIE